MISRTQPTRRAASGARRDRTGDVEEVNVVYVGHGGRLPARVRALIDFLVDEVDLDDASDLFE